MRDSYEQKFNIKEIVPEFNRLNFESTCVPSRHYFKFISKNDKISSFLLEYISIISIFSIERD